MSAAHERDLAHEADMRALRREQLADDFNPGDYVDAFGEVWGDAEYDDWLRERKRMAHLNHRLARG